LKEEKFDLLLINQVAFTPHINCLPHHHTIKWVGIDRLLPTYVPLHMNCRSAFLQSSTEKKVESQRSICQQGKGRNNKSYDSIVTVFPS
jgi:hypothetical protein